MKNEVNNKTLEEHCLDAQIALQAIHDGIDENQIYQNINRTFVYTQMFDTLCALGGLRLEIQKCQPSTIGGES